jgi:two-component system, NarL family, sensor kinase
MMNMFKVIIISLLIGIGAVNGSFAQSRYHFTDSMTYEIRKSSSDSRKIDLLIYMAKKLPTTDSTNALSYFQQALQLAHKQHDNFTVARVYFSIGSWYGNLFGPVEAEKYYRLAQEQVEKDTTMASRKLLAMARLNLATVLGNKGYTQEQVEECLQTIPLLEQLGDIQSLGSTYEDLGDIFYNKSQYKTAVTYYRKSVDIMHDASRYNFLLANRDLRLSSCMYYMDSLSTMETYLAEAKRKLALTGSDSLSLWSTYYEYQGLLAVRQQLYAKATQMFNNGISIARRYHDNHAISNNLFALAKLYVRLGQYPQAQSLMEECTSLAGTFRDYPFRLHAIDLMADIAYKQHDPDGAYDYLRQYISLGDSMQELVVTQKLHELETQYQSSEKEKRILQLQHDNEKQEFALQKNRLIISLMVVIMLSLFVVALLSYLFYRNGRKLLTQQQQLHALEVESIQREHHISLLSAMLEGQEQERTRLARDLHDGLGGLLSGIKLELSTISPKQDIPSLITNTLQRLDHAMDELRRIARSMMPEILIKYGLGEATQEYCRGLKKTGVMNIVCQVYNFQSTAMEQTRQVVLYRIMQELVNNAIKHAEANQILVILQQTGDTIFLTVEDDGKGFDTTQGNKLKGAGLANIQARVDFLGGTLDLQSEPGTGTTITIECAIHQVANPTMTLFTKPNTTVN